jgi:hypothetical protein
MQPKQPVLKLDLMPPSHLTKNLTRLVTFTTLQTNAVRSLFLEGVAVVTTNAALTRKTVEVLVPVLRIWDVGRILRLRPRGKLIGIDVMVLRLRPRGKRVVFGLFRVLITHDRRRPNLFVSYMNGYLRRLCATISTTMITMNVKEENTKVLKNEEILK